MSQGEGAQCTPHNIAILWRRSFRGKEGDLERQSADKCRVDADQVRQLDSGGVQASGYAERVCSGAFFAGLRGGAQTLNNLNIAHDRQQERNCLAMRSADAARHTGGAKGGPRR